MDKEKLIKEAIESWCLYGYTINKAFEFKDFLIESKPLENVLHSNSEEKIIQFISYVKSQIELLEEK
ncbi:MAG: hypothetical protein O9297_14270 [Flavobacterium sp.]|jgi:hypothetical protein|uniref:hypothetical protein n=1 Tax=Flavobacterium sp. TaxID=239 RepID=UPI0022BFD02B|nr:hypothetical protein [Flavobacterium sp.]MCZ8298372.1 hypothetical protein [Flavobacterium sp.]